MSALEALNWYESRAEASDETILSQRSRFELVEKRPAPLVLSDKEVLDWIGEYAHKAKWMRGTDEYVGHWKLYVDDLGDAVRGDTLRDAVCLAAAMLEEQS
jgi:hypothetical protein